MLFQILSIISFILFVLVLYLFHKLSHKNIALTFAERELSTIKEENKNFSLKHLEQVQKIESLNVKNLEQAKLLSEFEYIKKKSFDSAREVLFDLGEKLSKQLIDIHKKETLESRELAESKIKKISDQFSQEFIKITNMVSTLNSNIASSNDSVELIKNSLLSPSSCGKLAEITLENILKTSGLRKNLDFAIQYTLMGENNLKLRPDALVFLPSNNIMIIDAKASKFFLEDAESKSLIKTMNLHLRSLVSKEYTEHTMSQIRQKYDFNARNIITLMFLPTEQGIDRINSIDSDFLNRSWKMNIFPVGPTGLMNMLSLAKFQISEELMVKNYEKIIFEIKKLISSVSVLSAHAEKLGTSVTSASNNYDKFVNSFNHNFLSKVKNVARLGLTNDNSKECVSIGQYSISKNTKETLV